jgi:hypothetical protein
MPFPEGRAVSIPSRPVTPDGNPPRATPDARELKDRKPAPKAGLSATHRKRVNEREPIRTWLTKTVDQDFFPLKTFLHTLLAI